MAITINGNGSLTGITDYPNSSVGQVLQVVSVVDTDQVAVTTSTWTDYTSAAITPSSSTNKILIMHNVTYGGADNSYAGGQCYKSATGITDGPISTGTNIHFSETNTFGDSNYSLQMNASANDQFKMWQGHFYFLDTAGTTNAITYTFRIRPDYSARNAYINRPNTDPSNGYNPRPNTVTTLMEIAA